MHDLKFGLVVQHSEILEKIFYEYKSDLGRDFDCYRNHAYRVLNYCAYLMGRQVDMEACIAPTAAYHDLGIWTHQTFDYLVPSIQLIPGRIKEDSTVIRKIESAILNHHKLTEYKGENAEFVESFRRADLVDLSKGWITYGIDKTFIQGVVHQFPYRKFHLRLMQFFWNHVKKHPLRPLPMLKY